MTDIKIKPIKNADASAWPAGPKAVPKVGPKIRPIKSGPKIVPMKKEKTDEEVWYTGLL